LTGAGALARKADRWLTPVFQGMAILGAVAGGAIVALIGASVAMRHIANAPFRFTEELVGLLMTAAFFLVLPLVTLKGEHVRVQILLSALPARLAGGVSVAAGLFGAGFCLWFFWLSLPWFQFALDRQIKTEVARLLMYPWMALMPVSLLLTAVAFAIRGASGDSNPYARNRSDLSNPTPS
jgi:TRAP-type C4-dicarboxylate transport system permease small subunit